MAMQRFARTCLVLGSMFLIVLGCNSSPTEPESGISFQTVLKAVLPGAPPDLQGREAVLDRATWQAVWTDLHGGAAPPLPEIDFRREIVVLVQGPGCCGAAEILSIVRRRNEVVVTGVAQASTNTVCALQDFSVHVARLPRFDVPVRFVVDQSEKLC